MGLMLAAERAELFHFKTLRRGPLILGFAVIAIFALAALELNNFAWHDFPFLEFSLDDGAYDGRISVTVPAPTVRPPSRIAKRKPLSMATGVINSISIATLSPGITISMPSGNFATPVTSVVRK
jgi:hypothetical protein